MPTYEYICESCGYEFEQFQTIKAKPIRKCPQCGKVSLKRLIGVGAGVIFKGSGFYATDYRSESYKKAAESEKSATSKDTEKKESKSSSSRRRPPPEQGKKTESGTKEQKKSA